MKKRIRNIFFFFLLCMLCVGSLSACTSKDGKTKIVLTTGFAKNELFRINSASCNLTEYMVYLTNTQNQYENVFGEQIWEKDFEGESLEENVKETVLARIARIKVMNLMAKEKGIRLNDEEQQLVSQAAEAYFESLNETEISLLNVTLKQIEDMYSEYAIANKVYYDIIKDINPEISDDEARTIVVEHILLYTYEAGENGEREEYTKEQKEEVYQRATQIWQEISDGADFTTQMGLYNESEMNTYSIRRGQMDKSFEEAAFALATGEISDVIETDEGYEIIKCISSFDKEQTDRNKVEIVRERKEAAISEEYETYVLTLNRNLNDELWKGISFLHDEQLHTCSFFEIYEEYIGEFFN